MFNSRFGRVMGIAPVLLANPLLAMCEEPSTADRIRGNYENKIRFFAAPE